MSLAKKVLTLYIAIALLLSNFSMPVDAYVYTSAQELNELGLLSGITPPELNSSLTRMVGLTMILKVFGYDQEDADKVADSSIFNDLTGKYGWGVGWANIGVELNVTEGTDGNRFMPDQLLTKKEFLAFQLRILGYGIEESWEDCAKLSVQTGLIASESVLYAYDRFTKAAAADIIYAALSAELKNEPGLTLAQKLAREGVIDDQVGREQKILSLNPVYIEEVQPISNKKLVLTLYEPVSSINLKEWSLTDLFGSTVKIVSIDISDEGKTLTMLTEAQKVYYTYTLKAGENKFTFKAPTIDNIRPRISTISIINRTSIKVVFNEVVDDGALVASNYYSNDLKVTHAEFELDDDKKPIRTHVILTVTPQIGGKIYTLQLSNIKDAAGNVSDSSYRGATFVGKATDTTAPRLYSAYGVNPTRVQLVFSEVMEKASVEEIKNYVIPGLTVIEAVKKENSSVVYLTTTEQKVGFSYQITVSGVKDTEGISIASTLTNYHFVGSAGDRTPPYIVSAEYMSDSEIMVTFSEPVTDETGSAQYAYYLGEKLTHPEQVEKSKTIMDGSVWILKTLPQESGSYTLTVKGIMDLSGNLVSEDKNEKVVTSYLGDSIRPRLLYATSISNTAVKLIFSEPLKETTATKQNNYYIGEGLSYPLVVTMDPVTTNGTVWILTTAPQLYQTYTLEVSGVTDVSGYLIDEAWDTLDFTGTK